MIPIRITRRCSTGRWEFGFHDTSRSYGYYVSMVYDSVSEMLMVLKKVLAEKPLIPIRQCLIDDGELEMTPLDLNSDAECIAFILRYS